MVSCSKIILVVIAIVIGAGVAIWSGTPPDGKASLPQDERSRPARDFFAAPKAYDTRNGQEMKPRW